VDESFREFEATSRFCPRCRQPTPVRKKLLLVLPTGKKYDYTCSVCGAAVGGKTDNDATDFYRTAPSAAPGAGPPRPGPASRFRLGPPGESGSGR
jgi:hypothetical protein